ncbi:hypothetical protein H9Q09_00645 [Aurantimonas sp. DM33-3]|uniref:hypothetical protein n=1 Tax=Aurantimonas sp. DM33-3 TaxID=2766955 RepID=UPI001651E2E7|nr:hypothetical protein [Aurantimonas sp. DM33-3]MBC6714693.1 hypothetical protein [Aurantimonas sp. DM33-3]
MMMDSATGAPMSIADRAKLPQYDNVRGCIVGGRPAEEYYAALDAAADTPEAQRAIAQRDAAYDRMVENLSTAHRQDAGASKVAVADSISAENDRVRDQAFVDAKARGLDDAKAGVEASYEAMKHRTSNAWKG